MALVIQAEMVFLDTASRVPRTGMNNLDFCVRLSAVLLKYIFKALTGHRSRSLCSEDICDKAGIWNERSELLVLDGISVLARKSLAKSNETILQSSL